MKKTYLKPDADYIKFYTDEELTLTGTENGGSAMEGENGVGGDADGSWN